MTGNTLADISGIHRVAWPAPPTVQAFYTTRQGGYSEPPYDSFNMGQHVGDDPIHVAANRQRLLNTLPDLSHIAWLDQVHSNHAVDATQACSTLLAADASFTALPAIACAVMTADCLPVLFCDKQGTQVAAAHAGWRGLLQGILENTLEPFTAPRHDIMAWLGPAIGPHAFEVGAEVREAFLQASQHPDDERHAFTPNPLKPQHFFADIYALAKLRLQRAGVTHIYGGHHCTFTDTHQFFSYRREATTGRMCSLIYLST